MAKKITVLILVLAAAALAVVVDSRVVSQAVPVSIVVRPNKVCRVVDVNNVETITYYTEMTIRYNLQDANGVHLLYKNSTHTSSDTNEPLDLAGIATVMGKVRVAFRADKLEYSDEDIGE